MPLLKIHHSGPADAWAVWEVKEEEDFFSAELPEADRCPEDIRFPAKRVEWTAGRFLVKYLFNTCGMDYRGLRKDESGKPFPVESVAQVSISNSLPYIAVQVNAEYPVGLDIEKPRKNIKMVMDRILSRTERGDAGTDHLKMMIYWCAKEAMFKIHGRHGVIFSKDLRVRPFHRAGSGTLEGMITAGGMEKKVKLDYLQQSGFTLVTTNATTKP